MKKLIFTIALVALAFVIQAQETGRKEQVAANFQVIAVSGFSSPLGSYRNGIAHAKDGYFGGLAIDRYFKGGSWGLGFDTRFLNHNIRKIDTVFFNNGYLATDYHNHPSFQHVSVALGPSYRTAFGKFSVEVYLRGGLLFQGFPKYTQSIYVNQAVGVPLNMFDAYQTDNPKRITKSLMGLGGLRLNYSISKQWAVFFQADYLRTFGTKLMGDSSKFKVIEYPVNQSLTQNDVVLVKNDQISNLNDYYDRVSQNTAINVQSLNAALGIKFSFGAGKIRESKDALSKVTTAQKEIMVVVKDRQTGLALSGVTVKIARAGEDEEVSLSNADGEAERLKDAKVGDYQITAVKNGIAAVPVSITEADFKNAGKVIYKEIFHDDPRFTLIGETVSANDNTKLPGISTVLTNTYDNSNMTQTSDAEAKFVYQLAQKSDYHIVANQSGKFSQTEGVTTKGLDRSKTLYVTLKLGISNLGEGMSIVLKNIHYDFDQSTIRNDAGRILNNLVSVLNQNPSLRIELSSHTDSRGKDDYNLTLSQKRADAAVLYLVNKGIERSRLEARGYGELKLLNNCANGVACSEESHQANRRTEIKILKY